MAGALEELAAGQGAPGLMTAASPAMRRRKVALLFAGQGAQYPRQGAALYRAEAVFRATLDAASDRLGPINGRSLLEWCFGDDVSSAALADTAVTQPLLVAFEVALARLILSWGLAPDAVVGHSVGELAAACIAGALSFATRWIWRANGDG
jgi:acyl transferase domain-containing protein